MEFDDFDDIDDFEGDVISGPEYELSGADDENLFTSEEQSYAPQDDLITSLLKERGIEDSSKIQYEDDNGLITEMNWNDLDVNEQLEILRSTTPQAEDGLDDSEIQLLNTIRSSNLSPEEYIQYVQQQTIQQYIQNNLNANQPKYVVDDYTDDELYQYDLLNRIEGLSQEEAAEALEREKINEELFSKKINALRTEYKQREDEYNQLLNFEKEQAAQTHYNNFAKSIGDEIMNFNSIADGKLNLTNEDRQNLYEFITGFDQAGNSWFSKALNDPQTLVKMAWFALNGEQTLHDIQDFYNSQIIQIRKDFEQKSLKNNSFYKPKQSSLSRYDDDDIDF